MADAPNGQCQPAKKKHDAFDWVMLGVTLLGVVVLCGYTGLTAYQASIAKDTEQRQLRAYIEAFPDTVYGSLTTSPRAIVKVHNAGQTPALNVSVIRQGIVWPIPLPWNQSIGSLNPSYFFGKQDLAISPGQDYPVSINLGDWITDEQYSAIHAGNPKMGLYFIGIIYYDDVFGSTHYTNFCFKLGEPAIQGWSDKVEIDYCATGNNAK